MQQQFKVLGLAGEVLGVGPTAEAAIVNAAANMAPGTKRHLAEMGLTPQGIVENMIENGDYALVVGR
jgi:hypothetical protein